MNTSQYLVILGGMAACQIIAMALPYWMGLQAGRTSLALLQGEIEQLRQQLSVRSEVVVVFDVEGTYSVGDAALIKQNSQGVSYV
ncbi:hypothetical protein M2401_006244 [Pseudomonas sp. JUb42]|uniref:hypothetical protein n=1 Tax=Pseudomonas sp. JUb42 TaxID=2940611 RepID=UPI00216A77BD|nr:hypothetical protein [Pseudomonas sp. JUb42]MCS3472480.1 hypothetical protein [Pseudomonas sp. JUb42]